jgi:hypothetical protein
VSKASKAVVDPVVTVPMVQETNPTEEQEDILEDGEARDEVNTLPGDGVEEEGKEDEDDKETVVTLGTRVSGKS